MLILHLADIHFQTPQCLRPDTDPDLTFRNLMLQDLRSQLDILGPIAAILIGGDIAFKADPKEYGAAMAWIERLVVTSGCSLERIFVVPGNHDVDRGIIAKTPSIRNAQAAIKGATDDRRENVLREQFEDPDTSNALLRPIEAYNEFAKVFSCQIYSPDHLYWKQDLELQGGVRLRLNGLTSTILSGCNGGNDARLGLYMSPLQTGLAPEDDVVNLVMAHHPPDWCIDQDQLEDDFNDRAIIHLFGHKHRQRVLLADRHVRIGAAAVNPDRYEIGFEPGYNLIELNVVGSGADRKLAITAHLRHLQRNPEMYRPRLNGTESAFRHSIRIPGLTPMSKPAAATIAGTSVAAPSEVNALAARDPEAAMSDEPTRNIVYRFWQLSISQRREIANVLGLLEEGEMKLPEPERYGRALLRAGQRDLIDALAAEIKKREAKK